MDKDIALAFINGPGVSFAAMWIALLLFVFAVYWTGREYRADRIRRQANEEAQRGALSNIEQTLRVMKSEQDRFMRISQGGE
jgi:hypothetical protein